MWLRTFKIENFKSFKNSDTHSLSPHINVIVGQNNAGKTALLKALFSIQAVGIPHRESSIPKNAPYDKRSSVSYEIVTDMRELDRIAITTNTNYHLIYPTDLFGSNRQNVERSVASHRLGISCLRTAMEGANFAIAPRVPIPGFNYFGIGPQTNYGALFTEVDATIGRIRARTVTNMPTELQTEFVLQSLLNRVYLFDSHRIPQSRYPHGTRDRLTPDAANLAEVLAVLQTNPAKFARYLQTVRRILPLVKHVSVVPRPNNENEILVWGLDVEAERNDIAPPLSESGSGVAQILALVYVILQSEGEIIVIDEPNSFLHPRATKALMELIRSDDKHQYILTTHSAEVIAATKPERLFLLSIADEQTIVSEMNSQELGATKQILAELGAELSDVFGLEAAVWVEGPTEVEAFPLLLSAFGRRLRNGVSFVPLRATGDFEGKHAMAIADIYRNITSANKLLPSNLAIILDGDKSTVRNLDAIEIAFKASISCLKRRTFENYLLDTDAIAALLNETEHLKSQPTSPAAVKETIESLARDQNFDAKSFPPFAPEWLRDVNAPALLDALFQELTNSTDYFRKPAHSVRLTEWLLKNSPDKLDELCATVVRACEEALE